MECCSKGKEKLIEALFYASDGTLTEATTEQIEDWTKDDSDSDNEDDASSYISSSADETDSGNLSAIVEKKRRIV